MENGLRQVSPVQSILSPRLPSARLPWPPGKGGRVVSAALLCPPDRRRCSDALGVEGRGPPSRVPTRKAHEIGGTGEQALLNGSDGNLRGARRRPGPRCIPGRRQAAQDRRAPPPCPAASQRIKEKKSPSLRSTPPPPLSPGPPRGPYPEAQAPHEPLFPAPVPRDAAALPAPAGGAPPR